MQLIGQAIALYRWWLFLRWPCITLTVPFHLGFLIVLQIRDVAASGRNWIDYSRLRHD